MFFFAVHVVRAQTNATQAAPLPALTNAPPSSSATGLAGARQAQNLYRLGRYEASAKAYQEALTGLGASGAPTLRYNAACALYKAGRFKEAAELFQQLAQNADSAVLTEAQYNAGCALARASEPSATATNISPDNRVDLLERAGKSFQQALRTDADFQKARLNLTVITNALPDAREQAKLSRLMVRYGNTPPSQLAEELLRNQRSISQRRQGIESNTAPSRIEAFESLAALQADNTDLLIPLRAGLQQAISQTATNPQTAQARMQEVQRHLEATGDTMRESYGRLRDLDENADIPAGRAEKAVYGIWKSIADFPSLLQENISQQSNLLSAVTSITNTTELVARQTEALELTHIFQDRFAKTIPPEGTAQPPQPTTQRPTPNVQHPTSNTQHSTASTQNPSPSAQPSPPATQNPQPKTQNPSPSAPPPSTNQPDGITAETRAKIVELSEEASSNQQKALDSIRATQFQASLPHQQAALRALADIEKLLPKEKQSSQNQDQQQDQQKQDQQQEKQQDQQKDKQDQDQQEPQPKEEQQPQDQPSPEQQPEKPESAKPADDKNKTMTPEQVQALLEKARQREKDHQDEKRRNTYFPPSPVDRDW